MCDTRVSYYQLQWRYDGAEWPDNDDFENCIIRRTKEELSDTLELLLSAQGVRVGTCIVDIRIRKLTVSGWSDAYQLEAQND